MNRAERSALISAFIREFSNLPDDELECARIAVVLVSSRRKNKPIVLLKEN